MKQFKTISSGFISRYFPPQDERIIAGYVRAIEILSEFIFDTVEEEARIILKDISDDRYEELRQVALTSYSFDVFGTRKSFFDGGGGQAGSLSRNMEYRFTKTLRVCGMT